MVCSMSRKKRNSLMSDAQSGEMTMETAHDTTYKKSCATSDDSDQPAQSGKSSQIACAFYRQPKIIQRRIKENLGHTWWMYRLIRVLASHISLPVGFVVRRLN